jgi:hypothetical protein
MAGVLGVALVLLGLAALQAGIAWKLGLLGLAVIVFSLFAWFALLSKEERVMLSFRSS